jgi:hypothetical protein
MGGGIGNVQGHFEDMEFHDLHEEFLNARGAEYGGFISTDISLNENELKKVTKLVHNKNLERNIWSWKEPRTCLFVNAYEEVFKRLNTPVKYLIVYRDYNRVVDSLMRRDAKKLEKFNGLANAAQKLRYYLTYTRRSKNYLSAWVKYNSNLIYLMQRNSGNYICIDVDKLIYYDEEIYRKLSNWNILQESFVSFKDVYDPKLINEDKLVIKINNSKLLNEAQVVLENLIDQSTFHY